jgi:hypothetical protein
VAAEREYTGVIGQLTIRRQRLERVRWSILSAEILVLLILALFVDWKEPMMVVIGRGKERIVRDIRWVNFVDTAAGVISVAKQIKVPPVHNPVQTGDALEDKEPEGFWAFGGPFDFKRKDIPVAAPKPPGYQDIPLDIPTDTLGSVPSFSLDPGPDTGIFLSNIPLVFIPPDTGSPPDSSFKALYTPRPPDTLRTFQADYPFIARASGKQGLASIIVLVDTAFHTSPDGTKYVKAIPFKTAVAHRKGLLTIQKDTVVSYQIEYEYPEGFFFGKKAGESVYETWQFTPATDSLGNKTPAFLRVIYYFRLVGNVSPRLYDSAGWTTNLSESKY